MGTEIVETAKGREPYAIMKYPRMEGNYLIGIAGIGVPHEMMAKLLEEHKG